MKRQHNISILHPILFICGGILVFFFMLGAWRGYKEATKYRPPKSNTISTLSIKIVQEELDRTYLEKGYEAYADAVYVTSKGDTIYEGEISLRTRGNGTRHNPKKPYSIKFPYSINIEALKKAKSFNLLANWQRDGVVLNTIGLEMAKYLGISAPSFSFVRLYFNGKYHGLYQITNKIDIGKSGVDITDLSKENSTFSYKLLKEYPRYEEGSIAAHNHRKGVDVSIEGVDVTGGYILDNAPNVNYYAPHPAGFISDGGCYMRIRDPKYATRNEVAYIANYFNEMEEAIMSPSGKNKKGKHYSEYIDMDSWARYYLLEEVMLNGDGGRNGFLMYKDIDEEDTRFYAGPAWDFDYSYVNTHFSDPVLRYAPEALCVSAKAHSSLDKTVSGGLFYYLWQHDEWREHVKKLYVSEVYPLIVSFLESGIIDTYKTTIGDEMIYNERLWGCNSSNTEILRITHPCNLFNYHKTILKNRADFLYQLFSQGEQDYIRVEFRYMNVTNVARDIVVYKKKKELEKVVILESGSLNNKYYDAETNEEIPTGSIIDMNRSIKVQENCK